MPTNEERRQIAARLREIVDLSTRTAMCRVARDFGIKCDDGYRCDICEKEVFTRLADLIEPEERTCRAVRFETRSFVDGKTVVLWRCSECESLIRPSGSYCPDCGAKVVE